MKAYCKAMLLLLTALLIMSGCSSSLKKEQDEALTAVEEAFKTSPRESNNENKDIKYCLPFGFEIVEETANNIILKNGPKNYILFYNLQEDAQSKVVLDATLQHKEFEVAEQFQQENKLGYFLVNKISDEINEVTVGIGGIKLTGEVKTKSLKSEAETMMTIVNSVVINK